MEAHRMICDLFPLVEYRRFSNKSDILHWGQLKLLLSEIEFLLQFHHEKKCYKKCYHIVYAGAAPGNHINILLDLFPHFFFTLVDPNPMVVSESSRVTVRHELMTESVAAEFRNTDNVLFISDVRTGPYVKPEPINLQQERIHRDMMAQMSWYRAMRPACTLLKFRLPWNTQETAEYLEGDIMLPVFGKLLTHETRLCVHGPDALLTTYDCRAYEGRMAYFNQFIRDRNYDEHRFRDIISQYLRLNAQDLRVWLACNKIIRSLLQSKKHNNPSSC